MSYPIEFAEQNRWWTSKQWMENDKHIQAFQSSVFQWIPRLKFFLDFKKDIVYTLRGPRQVGKTTFLKLLIAEKLDGKIPPENVFYYACDLVDNPKELASIIEKYLNARRLRKDKDRLYLFLDEVSSVKGWQKGVKFLVDKGSLQNTTVILSGSHSLDLRVSAEQLPGRRGEPESNPDLVFVPVKFAEYAESTDENIRQTIRNLDLLRTEKRHEEILSLCRGVISPQIEKLAYETARTNLLLEKYLMTGGIPRPINEFSKSGRISEMTYRTYVDVVKGDLTRYGMNENYLRQILEQLIKTIGTPVGWSTLRKGTDVASSNTIENYVTALDSSFVLNFFYRMNAPERKPEYAKDKKVIFADPFFFHALNGWVHGRDPFSFSIETLKSVEKKSILIEQAIGEHCIRLAYSMAREKQLFEYKRRVMFWRSKEDREVDFVIANNSKVIPMEVKFQDSVSRENLYPLADFRKVSSTRGGIVVSKDLLEKRDGYSIVPASIFLLLV
jgi:hypothetical protein